MDNPVHHHVFIDGEWVDVYQIMAQARNSDAGEPESTPEPVAYTPEVGILSRTVFASPLFKFICPANIRHKDFTDVVLVGEDAVQLKQVHDYGHFRHVATKADFSGKILAARVFGEPRAATATASSPWPKKPTFHRARRSMTGDEDVDVLPPEVLVLTLTSRTLMFLWAQHTRAGSVSFAQKTLKLPFGRSRLDRFGTFLAIDHQHRAMAVAASEGGFILYKTKSMSQWREELQQGLDTTPISDERIISIEGRVQHMEFLSSGAGLDTHHVVLLFVVVYQGKTRLTCFDWDCREDLSKAVARTERVLVDSDDNNPSLLIPLTRTSDFLLVLDTHISIYKDVLSGAPRRIPVPIDAGILTSLLPGDSRYRPCWVAWDKTVRNPGFPKEAFYVAREDGRIMYVERDAAGEVEIDEAGAWPYRVDTAFACLSVDNSEFSTSYPDVLIAGGNGNDGLVCKVGSWPAEYSYSASYPRANQLSFVESIANWTPLTDMDIAHLPDSRIAFGAKRSSILVANGASPHGSISELRYGVQSLVEDSFGGMSGCTGLWVIDYGSHTVEIEGKAARQHWVTFAVALRPETLAIRIIRTQSESRGGYSGAWEDGSWDKCQLPNDDEPIADDLCRDEETLTACPWSEKFAVQVTPSEGRILTRPHLQLNHRLEFTNKLLLAASRPGFPAVVVVYREAGLVYLEVFRISEDGQFAPTTAEKRIRHQLDNDPTCITLFYIEHYPCIFTSTFDSTIYFFALEGAGLSLIHQESLLVKNRRVIIESAVVLSSKGQLILLGGTRNGFLINSPLELSKQTQFNWSIVHVGDETAQVEASSTDTSTAFVSCGSDFCRVRCPPTPGGALAIDSVWFTNRMNPGYLQAPVTAMYQLPLSQDANTMERNLGGFLFAVSGDQLLFSQLESDRRRPDDQSLLSLQYDCRSVPRTLFTGAKPTNILYLESYRKVAISTMEAKEQREPPNGYRALESSIQLLNIYDEKPLDEPEVKQEFEEVLANRLVSAKLELKNGERVYSLIEWSFEDHRNKKYNLIIAGTGIPTPSGKEKGRRIIISPGKTATKLQEQKSFDFDDPVYCAAIYKNNGIVSVIGKKLYLHTFDSEAGKMSMRANRDLPSPGTDITVDECFLQISTLQHSFLCFEVVQTGDGAYSFMQAMTDSRERNCARHLSIEMNMPNATENSGVSDKIILVTDKRSSSVTGLYFSPHRIQRTAADTLFEACLPHTVVRLQVGDIRPLWRRPYNLVNPASVIKDGIVGACSDGTIYNFAIIDQAGYHMLRYLQNIIEEKDRRDPAKRHTVIHARNGAIQDVLMNGTEGAQEELLRAHPLDPRNHDKSTAGPRNRHIDGDVLVRWRDEDGDLGKLVRDGAHSDVGLQFFMFAKALWEGYIQSEEHAIDMVSQWLNEVLMPLL